MRDLFDELKDHLPPDRGPKTSKWEILTRGEPSDLVRYQNMADE